MSKPRKKFPPATLIAWLILLLIAAAAVGYLWQARQAHRQIPSLPEVRRSPETGAGAEKTVPGKIYFLTIADRQQRLVPVAYRLSKLRPAEEALALLLQGAPAAGYESPLPRGTTLRKVAIADGLATADFSGELVKNFAGGSDNEAAAVFGIVNTLCSLPGVERVQILVEGKTLDSLGGHLDLSAPLGYDGELVVAGR